MGKAKSAALESDDSSSSISVQTRLHRQAIATAKKAQRLFDTARSLRLAQDLEAIDKAEAATPLHTSSSSSSQAAPTPATAPVAADSGDRQAGQEQRLAKLVASIPPGDLEDSPTATRAPAKAGSPFDLMGTNVIGSAWMGAAAETK